MKEEQIVYDTSKIIHLGTLSFKWGWCNTCDAAYVICPVCKNNLCNGGSGELENGEDCPFCILGYEYQNLFYNNIINPMVYKEEIQ